MMLATILIVGDTALQLHLRRNKELRVMHSDVLLSEPDYIFSFAFGKGVTISGRVSVLGAATG